MEAIQIEAFGNPAEVMKAGRHSRRRRSWRRRSGDRARGLADQHERSPDDLRAATGIGRSCPASWERKDVGRVVAVGGGVKHLKEGDRALVPYPPPAWAERIKADGRLVAAMAGGDINQFAMIGVNPATAYFLLTESSNCPSEPGSSTTAPIPASVEHCRDREIAWTEDHQCRPLARRLSRK